MGLFFKKCVPSPVYIGNPEEFTILALAATVIDLTGPRGRIVHRPAPQDDPRQRRPDISKAHELLAWKPSTPLKEGLMRTISYFEHLLSDQGVRGFPMSSAQA
jgi:UDP-glucuronate decarboxylase